MKFRKCVLFVLLALGLNSPCAPAAFRRTIRPDTERTMPEILNKNQGPENIRTKPKVQSEIPVSSAPTKSHRPTTSHTTPYQEIETSHQPPKSTLDHVKEQLNKAKNQIKRTFGYFVAPALDLHHAPKAKAQELKTAVQTKLTNAHPAVASFFQPKNNQAQIPTPEVKPKAPLSPYALSLMVKSKQRAEERDAHVAKIMAEKPQEDPLLIMINQKPDRALQPTEQIKNLSLLIENTNNKAAKLSEKEQIDPLSSHAQGIPDQRKAFEKNASKGTEQLIAHFKNIPKENVNPETYDQVNAIVLADQKKQLKKYYNKEGIPYTDKQLHEDAEKATIRAIGTKPEAKAKPQPVEEKKKQEEPQKPELPKEEKKTPAPKVLTKEEKRRQQIDGIIHHPDLDDLKITLEHHTKNKEQYRSVDDKNKLIDELTQNIGAAQEKRALLEREYKKISQKNPKTPDDEEYLRNISAAHQELQNTIQRGGKRVYKVFKEIAQSSPEEYKRTYNEIFDNEKELLKQQHPKATKTQLNNAAHKATVQKIGEDPAETARKLTEEQAKKPELLLTPHQKIQKDLTEAQQEVARLQQKEKQFLAALDKKVKAGQELSEQDYQDKLVIRQDAVRAIRKANNLEKEEQEARKPSKKPAPTVEEQLTQEEATVARAHSDFQNSHAALISAREKQQENDNFLNRHRVEQAQEAFDAASKKSAEATAQRDRIKALATPPTPPPAQPPIPEPAPTPK
ncbi:hypothetical protein IPF37_06260 [bacterium]|nr:MAG: hypothetical protein IPF37_06260 [bacterium]